MSKQDNTSSTTREVVAHYVKSNYCRVIHADGAWGGLTPNMNIHMALFSEHAPVPRSMTFRLEPSGLVSEQSADSEPGITREIDAEVILNLEVAKALRDWLDLRLRQAEELIKADIQRKRGTS